VTTVEGFDALEPAWNLLHDAHGSSPFQSFPWLRAWWRHYGEPHRSMRLHILVAMRGAGPDERVIAIAPLSQQRFRTAGLWPVTELAMLGRDRSDYTDLLVDPAESGPALTALAAHLADHSNRFDALLMKDVPEHSPSLALWLDALQAAGFAPRKRPSDSCPRVRLADTWDETVAALPPATRGKMLRRQKQLATRHAGHVELVEGPAVRAADVDDLVAFHQFRWTTAGGSGAFADQELADFVRDATLRMAEAGRLALGFLHLDGRRAAAVCGFLHRDEYHFYVGGMGDAGQALRYSPGIALHLWCMEALHARGVRLYDLLRGEEHYKFDLGAVASPTWYVTVYGRRRGLGRWTHLAQTVQSRGLARLDLERSLLREARAAAVAAQATTAGTAPATGSAVRQHVSERARIALRDARRRLPGTSTDTDSD
jgi:CelD/BcsL family acetyltransferase involved in cellulose biosynthesis